ncbi:acyl-CoA synthetase [Microbacterium sp. ER1]|uniref:acyl-CoA synthetase n=1 Tax=Microbacterium sp. ER1 TaxID=1932846 RepID=UPI00201AE726|nr:acyl-CoA synthetase [Microbacterium sp. ER1]
MSAPARAFTMRHVQLLRALFAAVAALMITFSSDHSAAVGLAVFSGFALVTALVHILAAWLVLPSGSRWSAILPAVVSAIAGMAGGVPAWRTDDMFFIVLITWGVLSGGLELLAGFRARRVGGALATDAITVGALGVLLAVVLLLIPSGFVQEYTIEKAGTFELSGIILGVGMFGGYAAIVAVFLGIAGLTPKRADADDVAAAPENDAAPVEHGGER